jgi:MarR family transcriptional regulator, organic hydroperoxide resistance regulator
METNGIISRISAIRTKANEFLAHELYREGLKDIAPSHGYILFVLFKNDGISMKEIKNSINKKKNTVTVLIDKLLSHGFLKKAPDANDGRTTRIFLTSKGKSLEKSFNSISDRLLKKAYKGFSESEKMNLTMLLNKMDKNF